MLPNMIFPAGVETVAIGGDNDDAGRMSARKAAENFAFRGIEARTFFPLPDHKDFNDEIRERARA
jgi:DNA primase